MQPDVAAWSHMYLQEITMVRAASLCNYVFVVPKKKKKAQARSIVIVFC